MFSSWLTNGLASWISFWDATGGKLTVEFQDIVPEVLGELLISEQRDVYASCAGFRMKSKLMAVIMGIIDVYNYN